MRTLLCPGDIITYTCGFSSSSPTIPTIYTQWTGSGIQCPATASSAANILSLSQQTGASLNTVPGSCGNLSAVMTNISGTCYTSVLTIPTPQYFNGTTVTCRDGNFGTLIGNDTLNIQLAIPPYVPTVTSLITDLDHLTVTWTSVTTATSYSVSMNGSFHTVISMHMYTFTGLSNNTVYTVSVVAINCAGSSSPATITGRTGPFMVAADPGTAAVGSSIGTAVGVSVSVTFVVSFTMGVLVASVLCYISRRSKESLYNPSSHDDPATVYDEVGSTKKRDAVEMNRNTAYGSYVSQSHEGDSIM
eukprot:Em0025g130a